MDSNNFFSPMQWEFFQNATHRWNFKTGATRSGKTHMDYYVIPKRIRNCTGNGLIVLIGNTQGTLERNIFEPMRSMFGDTLVGKVRGSSNTIRLFGRKCFAFGADKKTAVDRLRGSGIEYCYGDEVATWNEEVFNMLKSRLDKPNSTFDGTCNPEGPTHWLKKFLDSDADIYQQAYQIYDNPFLARSFVENLEREYAGTVYFDRYILGRWVAAEGIIYRVFANDPKKFFVPPEAVPKARLTKVNIGIDFGGNGSGTAFVASGFVDGYRKIIGLASEYHKGDIDPEKLDELAVEFGRRVIAKYGRADNVYCDSAEPILIRGIKRAYAREQMPSRVTYAAKTSINGRIRLTVRLMNTERYGWTEDAETLAKAHREALWDSKIKTEDVRLDDGTTDIDTLDAFEYSIEQDANRLIT